MTVEKKNINSVKWIEEEEEEVLITTEANQYKIENTGSDEVIIHMLKIELESSLSSK